MAKTPTPEEAVEHAQRIEQQRVESVRNLAQTRASLSDLDTQADHERKQLEKQIKERARQAEKDDLAAYNRSEEHTSELQSRFDLVCRLLLEKKKKRTTQQPGQRT